jgi:putative endonuclease
MTRRFIPTREWEDARQLRGLHGEEVAMAYLTSCGWSIEAHRHRLGRHDLDIVARKGRTVAFIEVKTRRSHACGTPLQSLGARQRRSIARCAELWRLRYGRPDDEYRFDLIAVDDYGGGKMHVEHVPGAWTLER